MRGGVCEGARVQPPLVDDITYSIPCLVPVLYTSLMASPMSVCSSPFHSSRAIGHPD